MKSFSVCLIKHGILIKETSTGRFHIPHGRIFCGVELLHTFLNLGLLLNCVTSPGSGILKPFLHSLATLQYKCQIA